LNPPIVFATYQKATIVTQSKPKAQSENQNEAEAKAEVPFCGIIMPISAMGIYDAAHWDRVRTLIDEAVVDAGYRPRLVSESEDIGVIHASIVQNLYDDPIVICDVSGKNANVMFELGLRLAFDKPTIVVKDDKTDYSFDTSPIKHIGYRADLRFDDVRAFQAKITEAIKATVDRKRREDGYSPFLGHFGKFKVAGLDTTVVDSSQFIVQQLAKIQFDIERLSRRTKVLEPVSLPHNTVATSIGILSNAKAENIASHLLLQEGFDPEIEGDILRFTNHLASELRNRKVKVTDIDVVKIALKVMSDFEGKKGTFS
jgi:hypothetical protein